jgi:hypothetical protein
MRGFTTEQESCIAYFKQNIGEWLKDDLKINKFVVICDGSIKGIYDTFGAAVAYAHDSLEKGHYIIQRIFDENEVVSFLRMAVGK